MMPLLRRSLFLLGCLLAISCNSDSPYYRVQFTLPDTVSLSPGESEQFDMTVDRIGDQPGELRVDLVTAPEGITLSPRSSCPRVRRPSPSPSPSPWRRTSRSPARSRR